MTNIDKIRKNKKGRMFINLLRELIAREYIYKTKRPLLLPICRMA